jgi:hypothetical protein
MITYVDINEHLAPYENVIVGGKPLLDWIVMSQLALQLNNGCTSQCSPLCEVKAEKRVTAAFSYGSLTEFVACHAEQLVFSRPYPYHRSDPVDYNGENGESIVDLLRIFEEKAGMRPYVSTSIPDDMRSFEVAYSLWKDSRLVRGKSMSELMKISKPYVQSGDGGKHFFTEGRLTRWVEYVCAKEGISPGDADKLRWLNLPIEEVEHFAVLPGWYEGGFIISPNSRKGIAGIDVFFHGIKCDSLKVFTDPLTPEKVMERFAGTFEKGFTLRSRMEF